MDISRQVVTARNEKKQVIATVTDYYDRFVHKLEDKYAKSSFTRDKLVLCPFHGDINPSMGLIKDKQDKQVEVFHCFGCGASGDIVKFHRRFVNISEQRNITLEVASKEVAQIYGIEINEEEIQDRLNNLLGERETEVEQMLGQYDYRAHSANLMKIRMVQESLSIGELAENLDIVLNKWKMTIKDRDEVIN